MEKIGVKVDSFYMNSLLQETIVSANSEAFGFELLSAEMATETDSNQALEHLSFRFNVFQWHYFINSGQVEWPLNLVIQPNCEEYNTIFLFLVHIQRAKYCLLNLSQRHSQELEDDTAIGTPAGDRARGRDLARFRSHRPAGGQVEPERRGLSPSPIPPTGRS